MTLFCPQKSLRTRCVSICLLLAFVATICRPARAGFPLHCIRPVPRVEGPIVPAPKNWGYRPTRWIRWEGTVVHPPLGPVPADAEKKPTAKDAETIATPPPVAETATPPETDHEPLEIPPLPLDDGPPQIPDNFGDDLPPLPGQPLRQGKPQKTRPAPLPTPNRDSAPPAAKPSEPPQKSGPDGSRPQFRDPDGIFEKKTPASPRPEPKKPQPVQSAPTPSGPPPAAAEDWKKRSRKKPREEKQTQKKTGKQPAKKKQPLYNPDSIFDVPPSQPEPPATKQPDKQTPAKQQPAPAETQPDSGWQPAGGKNKQFSAWDLGPRKRQKQDRSPRPAADSVDTRADKPAPRRPATARRAPLRPVAASARQPLAAQPIATKMGPPAEKPLAESRWQPARVEPKKSPVRDVKLPGRVYQDNQVRPASYPAEPVVPASGPRSATLSSQTAAPTAAKIETDWQADPVDPNPMRPVVAQFELGEKPAATKTQTGGSPANPLRHGGPRARPGTRPTQAPSATRPAAASQANPLR